MKRIVFTFLITLSLMSNLFAQEKVNFVTYGAYANPKEGDNDFIQIFFIEANETNSDSVLIELFDADCIGKNDVAFKGGFNSQFSFMLYGGEKVFSAESIKLTRNNNESISGKLLKELTLSNEAEYDDKWKLFAKVSKDEGENIDGKYYFKLVVEGINGDDANVFNVRVNDNKNKNVKVINYVPTIHLLPKSNIIQLRFFSGNNSKIVLKNYDADRAGVYFTSPYRKSIRLKSSKDGKWVSSTIKLLPFEENEICAVEFGPGGRSVNDAVFSVENLDGNSIPIILPIEKRIKNKRPVIERELQYPNNCNTVIVVASSSYDADGDSLSFKWVMSNGSVEEGSMKEFTFPKPGKYKITLAVKDNSKAVESGSYENISVIINNPPKAVAGEDKFRSPNEKIFFNGGKSRDSDGYIKSYSWDFGDGFTGKGKKCYHAYSEPGIYKVKLTVTDNSKGNCNTSSDSLNVWINAAPIADAGSDIRCSIGEVITLDASKSYDKDGHIISYQWFLGNGEKESGEKVFYKYNRAGKYKVTLHVTDDSNLRNNKSSSTITVVVNKPPKANAGKDIVVAVGETFILSGNNSVDSDGKITEYIWTLPDSEFVKEEITHSFSKAGKYKIKLKVKDDSGTKSEFGEDYVTIIVNAPPVADAGENIYQTNKEVSFNGEKSFDPDGKIVKYQWNFGDGSSISEKKNPIHTYKEPGIYKVKLVVYDNSTASNYNSSSEIEVRINRKPIADAGPDLKVADNEEFILSAENSIDTDGKIISTEWEIGNKIISTEKQFTYSFEKPGTYNIKLTVADDSKHKEAVDSDEIIVTVNEAPHIVIKKDYKIAKGESVTFDASKSYDADGKITKYEWFFENKKISDLPKFTKVFENGGEKRIKLQITDNSDVGNARAEQLINVMVNDAPVICNFSDIVRCEKNVSLSAKGTSDTNGDLLKYSWDFGDGEFGKGESVEHRYRETGVYPVVLTVDDGEGVSNSVVKKSFSVKINTIPIANAGMDEITCTGDLIILDGSKSFDADGDLLKYEWDFGDGTFAKGISVSKNYIDAGIYEVKLKVTDNSGVECNSSVDSKLITVVESPVAFAGEDIIGCANNPIEFNAYKSTDADGIVNSFKWDFGDGSSGGGEKTNHIYDKAGTYNVILTITGEETKECDNIDTDELIVTIKDAPSAEFISEDSVAVNSSVSFDATNSQGNGSDIVNYSWKFGDGSSATGRKVSHKFSKSGKYFITLIVKTNSKAECKTASILKSIYVNQTPIAVAGSDKKGIVGDVFSFDASASTDNDGKIKRYFWDFGDGTKAEGINVFHSFNKKGNYKVTLKVIDDTNVSNNSSTAELTVTVD